MVTAATQHTYYMRTPGKHDSQAAVVQHLTSDRLLASLLAEETVTDEGEIAMEQNAEEQQQRGLIRDRYH